MRALVVGDIHGEAAQLAEVIAHGAGARIDRWLSVGDIIDGPGDPVACVAQLRGRGFEVVRGNHERWLAEGHPLEAFDYPDDVRAWLTSLPATLEYETPTGRLLLGHGLGAHDMARLEPDTHGYALECLDPLWRLTRQRRYRWLIGGHTHVPMVRTIDGLTVINPGTLCAEREPGFMVVDFASAEVERWAFAPALRLATTWRLDVSGRAP